MKKTPEQRAQEKLAKLLGIEAPTPMAVHESRDIEMEAEAVLEYYENPRSFTHKECKHCGRSFATRGAPVAYCSNACRVKTFEERMGVKWIPDRKIEDRWGFMGEPLTVPHEALVVMQAVMVEQAVAESRGPAASELIYDDPPEEVNVLDLLEELGLS